MKLTPAQFKTFQESHEAYSDVQSEIEAIVEIDPRGKTRAAVTIFKVNGKWRSNKKKDQKTKSWENQFSEILEEYRPNKPFYGPLEVDVITVSKRPESWDKDGLPDNGYLLNSSKPDFDNSVKIVVDAINDNWFFDDAQISLGRILKLVGKKDQDPFIYFKIRPLCLPDIKERIDFLEKKIDQFKVNLKTTKGHFMPGFMS